MKICVIGAGYVGLIISLGFAKMGNNLICVDKDTEKINKLNQGIPTIYEPGINDLLKEYLIDKRILFTSDLKWAIGDSSIIFIAVETPAKDNWDVEMASVYAVINQLAKFINSYKVIVTKSTVPIGTQKQIKEMLINYGVLRDNFDVVANPEFLREGKALSDFLNGDRIVIGCDSVKAKDIMKILYSPFRVKMVFTTPETAELIKYASNAFLATKVSFINEIANFCNLVNADIDVVSSTLGLDKRISPEFFKAGIGFGGSCFPKDTRALVKQGAKYGYDFKIIKSAVEVNETQKILPVKILLDHYGNLQGKIISILGLTFKADTDDFREAPSLYIIEHLLKEGVVIKCYDPMVSKEIEEIFPCLEYCKNLYDSLKNSHCAVICTEWKEFCTMDLEQLKKIMQSPMIIDGRNLLDIEQVNQKGFIYFSIGKGQSNGNMRCY